MRFKEWLDKLEGFYGGSAYGPIDDLSAGGSMGQAGDDSAMASKGIRSKYKAIDNPLRINPKKKRPSSPGRFDQSTSPGTDWPRF